MSLKVLLEKAKTFEQIHREWVNCYNELGQPRLVEYLDSKWVSDDDLKQWLEKLNERALEIDKPSNDYAEVCKQTRQYRSLLKEVLGLPLEGIK